MKQITKSLLYILIITGLLLSSVVFSQAKLRFDKRTHGFGKVANLDYPPVVFTFVNVGNEQAAILMEKSSSFVNVKYTKGYIGVGFSGQVIIYPNVNQMGKFEETITIVTNGSPAEYTFEVSGEIVSIQECFIDPENFNLRKITVIDAVTKEPIPEADLLLKHNNSKKIKGFTNQKGEWNGEMPIGQYQFNISAKGYKPYFESKFIRRSVPYMFFELEPLKEPPISSLPDASIARNESPSISNKPNKRLNTKPESDRPGSGRKQQEVQIDQPNQPSTDLDFGFEEEPTESFEFDEDALTTSSTSKTITPKSNEPDIVGGVLSNNYAANNIVLLLDVSHSMNSFKRLELLKASILNLIDVLRPIDHVSLITYAGTPTVLFENIGGDQKEQMKPYIENLKASGITKGVKGLEKAYEIANHKFSTTGNNQIILATDGKFTSSNSNSNEILKRIHVNAERGIILSILGIGVEEDARVFMSDLVMSSKGSYIHVNNKEDISDKLIEEIKSKSIRH